ATVPDLTVVTNSIKIANVFHLDPQPGVTVILVGGVRTPSDALVGPVAVATTDAGLTTPNMLEAETDRALVDSATRRVVVADHTKWGIRGLSTIARLE